MWLHVVRITSEIGRLVMYDSFSIFVFIFINLVVKQSLTWKPECMTLRREINFFQYNCGYKYQESSWRAKLGQCVGWEPHRHLWADFLESMASSTSHNRTGFHGLKQWQLYIFTTWEYVPSFTNVFLWKVCDGRNCILLTSTQFLITLIYWVFVVKWFSECEYPVCSKEVYFEFWCTGAEVNKGKEMFTNLSCKLWKPFAID